MFGTFDDMFICWLIVYLTKLNPFLNFCYGTFSPPQCVCVDVCIYLQLYAHFEWEADGQELVENILLASGQREAGESSYQHAGLHEPLHHGLESSITHAWLQTAFGQDGGICLPYLSS